MKAVVVDRPGSARVSTEPDPTPDPGEIVDRVRACGICGTAIYNIDGEFPPTVYPIIPGHECGGDVVEVGAVDPTA